MFGCFEVFLHTYLIKIYLENEFNAVIMSSRKPKAVIIHDDDSTDEEGITKTVAKTEKSMFIMKSCRSEN